MRLVADLDELGGHPDPPPFPADAALEEVVDAQLAADLVDRLVRLLVAHRRGPGDDAEARRFEPAKLGDLPLIVLSKEVSVQDLQKVYALYPPAIQALATREILQRQADGLNGMQKDLAGLSTRGKQIIVKDSGHFIQLDAPQVVIDAIREVFEQVSS